MSKWKKKNLNFKEKNNFNFSITFSPSLCTFLLGHYHSSVLHIRSKPTSKGTGVKDLNMGRALSKPMWRIWIFVYSPNYLGVSLIATVTLGGYSNHKVLLNKLWKMLLKKIGVLEIAWANENWKCKCSKFGN